MKERNQNPIPAQALVLMLLVIGVLAALLSQGLPRVALTETYISPDEQFSFQYPKGWTTNNPYVSNPVPQFINALPLNNGRPLQYALDIKPSEIEGAVTWSKKQALIMLLVLSGTQFESNNPSIEEIASGIVKAGSETSIRASFQKTTLRGRPAIILEGRTKELEQYGIMLEFPNDNLVMFALFSLPGEMDKFKPLIRQMVESVKFIS
ncbi:MAG: hypothetical protein R3E39_11825 [Anaerolineae bacterium]